MVSGLEELIIAMEEGGLFGFVLPLILVFALVFGILDQIQIFKNNKKVNTIISLVLAAYVMIYSPFAPFIQSMAAMSATFLVFVLFVIMGLGLIYTMGGKEAPDIGEKGNWAILIVVLLVFVIIFISSGGLAILLPGMEAVGFEAGIDWAAVTPIIVLLVIFGAMFMFGKWIVTPSEVDQARREREDVRKDMKRLEKRGKKITREETTRYSKLKDREEELTRFLGKKGHG